MRASPLRLLTLGNLELHAPGGVRPEDVLRQPKRAALLVFLALQREGEFVSRHRLLAVFWPESGVHTARSNLRQSVRFLTDRLPNGVVVSRGRDALGVDPGRLRCDAHELRRLVSLGRADEALELYRGHLLDGFFFRNSSPEFEEWLAGVRAGLQRCASEAAWDRARSTEQAGHMAEAAFWAKRAVDIAPRSEPTMRQLMLLLERAGDRAGALRAYRGLEEWLAEEFAAAPSPDTRALAERLRASTDEAGEVVHRDRRSGLARRSGAERRQGGRWNGTERRIAQRRSPAERRSGRDRRRIWG